MNLDPSQQRAVDLVCTARVGVVTGGPGTGKTTSLRAALDRLDAAGITYALGSPTGKASRRMMEATGRDAYTVHRLLEWFPREQCFLRRFPEAPFREDLIVIDESSMLDVELARALFAAVDPTRTRVILIGDGDQLPSVGPGRVFADLIESGAVPVARLTTLHRAARESWVCSQAPVILAGRVPDLRTRADFVFREEEDRDTAASKLVEMVYRRACEEATWSLRDVQVLVPQNVGPAGADALNRRLQNAINPCDRPSWKVAGQTIKVGDRVIQTKNVYSTDGLSDVMNGETGDVVRVDADELVVRFDDGREIAYSREAATKLRLAYALTVHKSQGSEWPWVVVMAHSTHAHMLSRNLLYTAITRAKKGVVIVGDRRGIELAVRNARDAKRNTGLAERLREAMAEGSEAA